MKNKALKIICITFSVILVAVIGFFANAFFGNPVSKALATSTAKKYVAQSYADTDYYVEKVGYNLKTSGYYAVVKSPSSIDTHFSLYMSMLGKLSYDSYENVTNGFTTAQRLEDEYRALTDKVINGEDFAAYNAEIAFGTLEIYPWQDIEAEGSEAPFYAINQSELEKDKLYDVNKLGKSAGKLVIYVDSDTVTAERAAKILIDIKRIFDKEGVSFKAIDFTLQYPKNDDGTRPDGYIGTKDFLYSDIKERGLAKKIARADEALKQKYAETDDIKEKEIEVTVQ